MNNPNKPQRQASKKRTGQQSTANPHSRSSTRSARAKTPVPMVEIRLQQIQAVLDEMLHWRYPADAVLSHWLRANPKLGMRDRVELADSVFDVLRHLRRYRHYAQSGSGPALRRLAILGLCEVLGVEKLAPALAPEEVLWLEHVRSIDVQALSSVIRCSLPDWLPARLATVEDADELIDALNKPAALDLRVNSFKTDRETVLKILQEGSEARFNPQPTPYSPWGIRIQGRPPVNRWALFERGEIEVQDEGSQILAALVAPRRGEMVIDYCAGAGGKTLLLGALMRSTGRLYAFDVSAARLARAKPRFARSGLSNIVPVVISADKDQRVRRLWGKADRVLVDAPCSGLGTLRRNPDLKWRQSPETIAQLCDLQASILQQAAKCVKPGGRLVYATCSILPEENQQQVETFLADHPEFELLDACAIIKDRCKDIDLPGPYLSMRPDRHATDGFFAAVMQRNKD